MKRPDFFQKVGCGPAGIQCGEFISQFQQRRRGAGGPEGLLSRWRCLQVWPEDRQSRTRGPQQDQGITEVVIGEDVVAGAVQQLPQVSEHIHGLIDAQYGESPRLSPRRCCLSAVKGQDGVFLGFMGVEQGDQSGHLQNLVDALGQIAQLQIAAGVAGTGQQPHQHSQSAAVDENYLAKMQNDVAAIRQELAYMLA